MRAESKNGPLGRASRFQTRDGLIVGHQVGETHYLPQILPYLACSSKLPSYPFTLQKGAGTALRFQQAGPLDALSSASGQRRALTTRAHATLRGPWGELRPETARRGQARSKHWD